MLGDGDEVAAGGELWREDMMTGINCSKANERSASKRI
jgi:hypothetical protein